MVVSAAEAQSVCLVKGIVTGQCTVAHESRVSLYVNDAP